jgi:cytochrome c-type biogenesis protein CcmH/NrfG
MSRPQTTDNNMVKLQTLIGAVVLSLIIGFIGGAVYTSMTLSGGTPVAANKPGMPAPSSQVEKGVSDDMASQIFKLETYLKENPKDDKAWAQLGNLFFDSDQYANSIDAYNKSLELNPKQIGVITDMGVMYRRNKQPEKAIEAFDKAIALDPKFETARFNKGIVLLHDLNDVAGGIKAWEDLVAVNPFAMAPNGDSVDAIVQRMKNQQTNSSE